MSAPRVPVTVPPILLGASALAMSVDSFDRYVGADVGCVRRGSLRLYPVAELERWALANAEVLLERRPC